MISSLLSFNLVQQCTFEGTTTVTRFKGTVMCSVILILVVLESWFFLWSHVVLKQNLLISERWRSLWRRNFWNLSELLPSLEGVELPLVWFKTDIFMASCSWWWIELVALYLGLTESRIGLQIQLNIGLFERVGFLPNLRTFSHRTLRLHSARSAGRRSDGAVDYWKVFM